MNDSSKYRVSFVPKKNNIEIDRESLDVVNKMLNSIIGFIKMNLNEPLYEGSRIRHQFYGLNGLVKHASFCVIGRGKIRTICAPPDHLKEEQKEILARLSNIPVHQSAHGFVRNKDPLSCATAHTEYWGSKATNLVILNMDAKDFFHSVTTSSIRKSLKAHNLLEKDIDHIIKKCTLRPDKDMAIAILHGLYSMTKRRSFHLPQYDFDKIIDHFNGCGDFVSPSEFIKDLSFLICQNFLSLGAGITKARRFLPQGAPTSPCLSNLALKIVDIRLSAMVKAFGGFYTRYADDFTVSWQCPTKGKIIDGMYRCTELVLKEYHLTLNRAKKKVMGKGMRQDIVGYCVNSGRPTISKQIRNKIRAAVHNDLVRGSQNLRSGKRTLSKHENHKRVNPTDKRISFLNGHIGRLCASHPLEAESYFSDLRFIASRTSRDLNPIQFTPDEIEIVFEE